MRDGLRKQEILDLHDYLDFHWSQNAIFPSLSAQIADGRYAASRSLSVRIEKKLGVTRTLIIPCAEDAVVLQCIVEALHPAARKAQPSRNSFFSRSHGFQAPELRFLKDYIWFKRWAEFAKLRMGIVTTHKFICVTDIANYFDNIDYRQLRNTLTTLDAFDEVLFDILFHVLDTISWRPDYLPSPGRSLPQVNFDAPRLLAHIFLFEIDAFLKEKTSDHFVRWVDDITIAARSRTQGKQLLRDLDELLMTRGLRLNSGKTVILSAKEAHDYFWTAENSVLDQTTDALNKAAGNAALIAKLSGQLRVRFDKFLKKKPLGHWDKVYKRFLTLFTRLKDPHALLLAKQALIDSPALRESYWRYLRELGASNKGFQAISSYVRSEHALDDASLFQVAYTLTSWEVPPASPQVRRIRTLAKSLGDNKWVDKSPFYFVVALWLLGKYGNRRQTVDLIRSHQLLWQSSSFLSRQVASILPKLRKGRDGAVVRKLINATGHSAATSVVISLDKIAEGGPSIPGDLALYILNGRQKSKYSLQRFLICLHTLTSTAYDSASRNNLRTQLYRYLQDPLYLRVVRAIHL